jgi:hypothetical protein
VSLSASASSFCLLPPAVVLFVMLALVGWFAFAHCGLLLYGGFSLFELQVVGFPFFFFFFFFFFSEKGRL